MWAHPRIHRGIRWLIAAGCLWLALAAPGLAAAPTAESAAPPRDQVVTTHPPKPRDHFAVGDRWRVRATELPMQMPEPSWLPVETWVFAVTRMEQTKDGPRLIVTVTREGGAKPTVTLQIDPETQAIVRAETQVPVQGGERTFVERPVGNEPFVSDVSPVPIALPTPMPGLITPGPAAHTAAKEGAAAPGSPTAAGGGPPLFSFGSRFSQRTEPVDAGVGRAKIESGLEPLKLRRQAGLEPAGIPRYQTIIEGAGQRIEQEWDDTTPWPLYSQTQTSRSWLVDYQKGK